jgi:hypothetical protein
MSSKRSSPRRRKVKLQAFANNDWTRDIHSDLGLTGGAVRSRSVPAPPPNDENFEKNDTLAELCAGKGENDNKRTNYEEEQSELGL